jgi:hypothetical protein
MGRTINLVNPPEVSGLRETVDRRPDMDGRTPQTQRRGRAMPMFEIASGRARLVQPTQPHADSFMPEVRAILGDHLGAVVGEDLFVVRGLGVGGASDILALDATGRPIVIAVTYLLDRDAMTSALERAGLAARMTEPDLVRTYHPGDPTRFGRDFADFRASLPFGAQVSQHMGPRLVVVCSDIVPEMSEAAGPWRTRGGRLEIFQVGVVRGDDDRRMLVLAPFSDKEPQRRPVEPSARRLSHGGVYDAIETTRSTPSIAPVGLVHDEPETAAPSDDLTPGPVPPDTVSPDTVLPDLVHDTVTVPKPLVDPDPVAPVTGAGPRLPRDLLPTQHSASEREGRPYDSLDTIPPIPPVAPAPASPSSPSVWAPRPRTSESELQIPDFLSSAELTIMSEREVPVDRHEAPASARPTPVDLPPADLPPVDLPPVDLPPAIPPRNENLAPRVRPEVQPATSRPEPRPTAILPPPGTTRASHAVRATSDAFPELVDLAGELGAPTELVWRRLRRGERFVVHLRADGLLELPNGRAFDDPSEAAAEVARSDGQIDGWRAWRIGDDGPTLADAIDLLHQ